MIEMTNYIKFDEEKGTLKGNIAALDFDFDIYGEAVNSQNSKAPVYRIYGHSPRGRLVEIGGIWEAENGEGQPYWQLTVTTPGRIYRANLGRYPGQDDDTLKAVIAWK